MHTDNSLIIEQNETIGYVIPFDLDETVTSIIPHIL